MRKELELSFDAATANLILCNIDRRIKKLQETDSYSRSIKNYRATIATKVYEKNIYIQMHAIFDNLSVKAICH